MENLRAAIQCEGDIEHLDSAHIGMEAGAIRVWNFHFCERFEGDAQNSMTRLYEMGVLAAAGFTVA